MHSLHKVSIQATMLTRIRELTTSNLGQETDDVKYLRSFPQYFQENAGILP
jgi:hypothetical protein